MTIREAWDQLEQAQLHLQQFIQRHGGVFDEEVGCYNFPVVTQTAEFGGLAAATRHIGDAQGYLEELLKESTS